jgi:hypothetical protein
VKMFPEQQFDVPSPYLNLEIETDGRAVAPETTEDTDETTENTSSEGTGPEDNPYPDEPAQQLRPAPQSASPSPQSASPAPQAAPLQPAPGGPRRAPPRR